MNPRTRRLINSFVVPVLAILSGLILMGVLILASGRTLPQTFEAYGVLFTKGFSCSGKTCSLLPTLERATPIILTGLSAVVAFRSGLFSIGQEGQYLMGAVVAAWLGYAIHLPPVIHPIVIMLACMLAGAIYGFVPGILRVKLGVNELLATIMLNAIAVLFVEYMVQYPMRANMAVTAHSPVIDQTAYLQNFVKGSNWGWGFVIAILAAVIIFIYLWKTKAGYEQRMAGQSHWFALFGGIPSDSAAIRAMIISGALSGLAGAVNVLGVHHRIMTGFSEGLGFDGLTSAILGQTHPLGVFIVAILFAGVKQGAQLGLQIKMNIPRELGGTIIGFIILFIAARKIYENGIDGIRGWFKKPGPSTKGGTQS